MPNSQDIRDKLSDWITFLNSIGFYQDVSYTTLWVGSIGFTIFALYMIWLRPKMWSLDFGWTWVIASLSQLFVASLVLSFYPEAVQEVKYIMLYASFVWIFITAAVAFTFVRFIMDRWQNRAKL